MKNVKILSFAMAASMLLFTACNSEGKERDDEKNETETAVTKRNTTATTPSANTPVTTYSVAQLPAVAKDYVAKNYSGYTIEKAVSDPLCQGGDAIDVAITKQGMPVLSLIFTPDGKLVQKEQDEPYATAPPKIKQTIKTKYASYSVSAQIEKLTLADNTTQYLVDLAEGATTKEVILKADGTVVCEK